MPDIAKRYKNHLVSLTPPFLGEKMQFLQLLPIVKADKPAVLNSVDQVVLDCLQFVYGGLVWRGPELGAVVQLRLDNALKKSQHH